MKDVAVRPGQFIGPALNLAQPDIPEQLFRSLGLKGDLPQGIAPFYNLQVITHSLLSPEYRWLRREASYFGGNQQAAVAAQFGSIVFGGFVAGNRGIAVVEKIVVANISAGVSGFLVGMEISNANLPVPTIGGSGAEDRVAVGPGGFNPQLFGIGQGTFAVAALTPPGRITMQLAANESRELVGPWILTNAPIGAGRSLLAVQSSQVNTALAVAFYWRERAALASELS